MQQVDALRELDADTVAQVVVLVEDVGRAIGHRPMSDQQWIDLTRRARSDAHTVTSRIGGPTTRLVGYCQFSPANDTWTIEMIVATDLDPAARVEVGDALLEAALDRIGRLGGREVHWWVFEAGDVADRIAARHDLAPLRTLHQMRAPLPLQRPVTLREPVEVRPFRIGEDEQDWLIVNNAAFADHPEQGGWTTDTVRQRELEPWFEPDGFLLHHRDGRLAAFCWTKLHRDESPVLGEIYVIAVHPDFHGLGLGKAMTVAGLTSIVDRGVTDGMLFVDHDNTAAFELYVQLGFTIHRTDRAFVGTATGAAT